MRAIYQCGESNPCGWQIELSEDNAELKQRIAQLEAQIESAHRVIDTFGLSRCGDSHEGRDANGCVTCDDGKPPLSLAERTKWLIDMMPHDSGEELVALTRERAAARQSRARLVRLVRAKNGEFNHLMKLWGDARAAFNVMDGCYKQAVAERDSETRWAHHYFTAWQTARQSRARLVGLVRHLRAWFSATAPDSAFVKRITDERDQYITQYTQVKQVANDARLEISALNEIIDDLTAQLAAARAWAAIWKQRAKAYRENFNHLDREADALCQSCTEARAWAAAWKRAAKWWWLASRDATARGVMNAWWRKESNDRREARRAAEAMERR